MLQNNEQRQENRIDNCCSKKKKKDMHETYKNYNNNKFRFLKRKFFIWCNIDAVYNQKSNYTKVLLRGLKNTLMINL